MKYRFSSILFAAAELPLGDVVFGDQLASQLDRIIEEYRRDLAALSQMLKPYGGTSHEIEGTRTAVHALTRKLTAKAQWALCGEISDAASALIELSNTPGHQGLRRLIPLHVSMTFADVRQSIREPGRRKADQLVSAVCRPTNQTPFVEHGETPDALGEATAAALMDVTSRLIGRKGPCAVSRFGPKLLTTLEAAHVAPSKGGRTAITLSASRVAAPKWSKADHAITLPATALMLGSCIWQAAQSAEPDSDQWRQVVDRVMTGRLDGPAITAPDGISIKFGASQILVEVPADLFDSALANTKPALRKSRKA